MKKTEFMKTLQAMDTTNMSAELTDRIQYTLKAFKKNPASVDIPTLTQLHKDIENEQSVLVEAVEASVKKPISRKALGKKAPAPAAEKVAAPAKKSVPAKKAVPAKKSNAVETAPPSTNASGFLPSAKMFPETIEHEELGTLKSCHGRYQTYVEVKEALVNEKPLYFAAYWTKAQLKKYEYARDYDVPAFTVKKGFPNDLDLVTAVLACDNVERVIGVSIYTEALYKIVGEAFEYIEDKDPSDNSTFNVRVMNGMEFEIYEIAEDAE